MRIWWEGRVFTSIYVRLDVDDADADAFVADRRSAQAVEEEFLSLVVVVARDST
jgi:hypothetical protein